MRSLFKSKRGAAYVEHALGLLSIVMVASLVLGIFELFTLHVKMDRIAEELADSATFTGQFGPDFEERAESLKSEFFDFDVNCGADVYFNSVNKSVQLGELMWVEITVSTTVSVIGMPMPITLTSRASGLSERYWK